MVRIRIFRIEELTEFKTFCVFEAKVFSLKKTLASNIMKILIQTIKNVLYKELL